jgi:hypothetical protein
MNLNDLASIGEFVGGFAVLITLIYLAIELRGNTKALKAEVSNTSYVGWSEFNAMLSQHPDKLILARAFDPQEAFEDFTPIEQFTLACVARTMMQRFSAAFFQYKAGILDAANWKDHAVYCHSIFSLPVWAAWWKEESKQPIYSQEFLAAIETAAVESVYFGDGVTSSANTMAK